MKRSTLVRKTPLKRTSIRRASDKQRGRLAIYRIMLAAARQEVAPCEKCRVIFPWGHLEPHHPFGRGGENLFKVVMVCKPCHSGIHAHANDAFAAGWLQPEYRHRPHDPSHPRPWKNLITA